MLAIGETVSKLSLALLNDFKSKVRDDTEIDRERRAVWPKRAKHRPWLSVRELCAPLASALTPAQPRSRSCMVRRVPQTL